MRGLSCPAACGILVPQPGIELASPALQDQFLTNGPLGKSLSSIVYIKTLKKIFKRKECSHYSKITAYNFWVPFQASPLASVMYKYRYRCRYKYTHTTYIWVNLHVVDSFLYSFFKKYFIYLFIHLAASNLSCGTWALHCGTQASL